VSIVTVVGIWAALVCGVCGRGLRVRVWIWGGRVEVGYRGAEGGPEACVLGLLLDCVLEKGVM
jgi:hypothetical protein